MRPAAGGPLAVDSSSSSSRARPALACSVSNPEAVKTSGLWRIVQRPEGMKSLFRSADRARSALQRQDLPDGLLEKAMEAIEDCVMQLSMDQFGSMRSSISGVPATPVVPGKERQEPRDRRETVERWFPFNALVARPVNKPERLATPDAQVVMKNEWDRLREQVVWDESAVRDKEEVGREAKGGSISGSCSALVPNRTRGGMPATQDGSLEGAWYSRATMFVIRITTLLCFRTWAVHQPPWRLLGSLTGTDVCQAI